MVNEPSVRIELTREEAELVINALHIYLSDFGHEQADLLHRTKKVLEHFERTVGPRADMPYIS